jgi:hypothetical protein
VGFKVRENVVMTVARLEMKTQFKPCGGDQAFQCREGWLSQVALVCRDHRRVDAGLLGQLFLTEAGLKSSEGEYRGRS